MYRCDSRMHQDNWRNLRELNEKQFTCRKEKRLKNKDLHLCEKQLTAKL